MTRLLADRTIGTRGNQGTDSSGSLATAAGTQNRQPSPAIDELESGLRHIDAAIGELMAHLSRLEEL